MDKNYLVEKLSFLDKVMSVKRHVICGDAP